MYHRLGKSTIYNDCNEANTVYNEVILAGFEKIIGMKNILKKIKVEHL